MEILKHYFDMACPIVPKSLFSETKRSTRLLLNCSYVYKSPARRTSRFQHGAFRSYPNDHEHFPAHAKQHVSMGFPLVGTDDRLEVAANDNRRWKSETFNGDCHWPRRGHSWMQTLFSINYCMWLHFGLTRFICVPAIKTAE